MSHHCVSVFWSAEISEESLCILAASTSVISSAAVAAVTREATRPRHVYNKIKSRQRANLRAQISFARDIHRMPWTRSKEFETNDPQTISNTCQRFQRYGMYVHIIFSLPPPFPPLFTQIQGCCSFCPPLLCEKEISEFYLLTPTYIRVPRTSSTTSSLANT